MKILPVTLALLALSAPAARADLSLEESESLTLCAQQFGLLRAEEIGEQTAFNEIRVENTPEGSERVYAIVQGSRTRGYVQIDVQGDVNQITKDGKFLKSCQ